MRKTIRMIKRKRWLATFSMLLSFPLLQAQELTRLRIDPSKAYGGVVSEYFDEIEYIPLETSKQSTFGDINDLIITDSSFVISDLDTRAIYFFSLKGRFITKVDGQLFIIHDQSKNQIVSFKISSDQSKIYFNYFSLLGKKMQQEAVIDLKGVNSLNDGGEVRLKAFSKPLGDDYFLYTHSIFNEDNNAHATSAYLYSIYKNDSLYKNVVPVNENVLEATRKLASGYAGLPKVVKDGTFYITTPLDFNLYKVSKDTVVGICQLVFPADRVLSKSIIESTNKKLLDSIKASIYTNRKVILNTENVFFWGSKLFYKIRTPSSIISFNNSANEYQYNFIYDTVSKKLSSLDRITPNGQSFFLPIMGETSKMRGIIPYQKYLYSYLSSMVLFKYKENTQSKNPQYPPVLQEYFRTQSRKSNPVIVRMKLKE